MFIAKINNITPFKNYSRNNFMLHVKVCQRHLTKYNKVCTKGAESVSEVKKTIKRNTIVVGFRTLATAFAISVLAIILVMTIPADLGAPYEPLQAGDSYTFDPWEISLGRLHLSFPNGGVLVGAYRRGELTGLVLMGDGVAIFSTDESDSEFSINQVVLQAHPSEISVLRGQTYIEPQVLPEQMQQADSLLLRIAASEPVLEVFGTKKVFVPRRGVLTVDLISPDNQQAHYTQAARTVWQAPGEPQLIIYNPDAYRYPPHDQYLFSLSILTVMVAAVAAGVVFVTPHYVHLHASFSKGTSLFWPLSVAIIHPFTEAYLSRIQLSPLVTLGWRVMVVAAILWIADTHGEAGAFLGFKQKGITSAIGVGLLCGVLLYLCGSIALPDSFNDISVMDVVVQLFTILVTRAVFQELLWRGLVQGSLRQRFSGYASIAMTTLLAALTSLAPSVITGQYSTSVYIQSFFIVPLGAFILGYVYERTSNLYAPIATVTLLGLAPLILRF